MTHLYVLVSIFSWRPVATRHDCNESLSKVQTCHPDNRLAAFRVHDRKSWFTMLKSRFRQLSIQNGSERIISLLRVGRVASLKQRRGVQPERIKMSPRY